MHRARIDFASRNVLGLLATVALLACSGSTATSSGPSSGDATDASDASTDSHLDVGDSADVTDVTDAMCPQTFPSSETACTVIGLENPQPNCLAPFVLYVDCPTERFLGVDCRSSGALPKVGREIQCCRCVSSP